MKDIKILTPPTIEEQLNNWIFDSHYWIDENNISICKWCGKIMPNTCLTKIGLCLKNPEIIKEFKNK